MKKKGVTLIEVIVSVAIIGMLMSLLFVFMGSQNVTINKLDIVKMLYTEVSNVLAEAVVKDTNSTDGELKDKDGNDIILSNQNVDFDIGVFSIDVNGVEIQYEVLTADKDIDLAHANVFTHNFPDVVRGDNSNTSNNGGDVVVDVVPVSTPFPDDEYYVNNEPSALLERMSYDNVPNILDGEFYITTLGSSKNNTITGENIVVDSAILNANIDTPHNSDADTKYVIYFDTNTPVTINGGGGRDIASDEVILKTKTNNGSPIAYNADIILITKTKFIFNFDKVKIDGNQTNHNPEYFNLYFVSKEISNKSFLTSMDNTQVTMVSVEQSESPTDVLEIEPLQDCNNLFIYYPNKYVSLSNRGFKSVNGGIVSKGDLNLNMTLDNYNNNFSNEPWLGRHDVLGFVYQ